MKDLTDFSAKQQKRIDNYLRTYGICYFENIEGDLAKDIIVKDPRNITTMHNMKNPKSYGFNPIRQILDRNLDRNSKNSILINEDELTWFQRKLLKIAGLM